jgi:PAS domain S-box-containing protein
MESREPVNILLVDDQPAKLLSYEAILSDLGENLIKATSGNQALECLLRHRIAVVLVDVCMPDLDGYELTSLIRSHPRFQKTSIILVSGVMTEDVDRLRGYVSGAVDYVSVPIVPEILRAKVSVFTDLFRKTEELERLNRDLEQRVEQRTAALSDATQKLARAYEASRLLASIVESSGDAIVGQTLDGTIRTWNAGAEGLYGYSAEEMVGQNVKRLAPADRAQEESGMVERLRAGERVAHLETVRLRKDGTPLEVSLTLSPILDESGNIIGTSKVARDITEQKRAAEAMRETQKLESLGVLAGGIAHDFNNLLVGILGNATLALEMLPEESPGRAPIEGVVVAGERAAALTRQMLAYSGRGRFVLERIDLSRFVRETIPLIEASISRSVELRLDLARIVPVIDADAGQLQQVLMNLVINGAEAITDGRPGTVTITTRMQKIDSDYMRTEGDNWSCELKEGTYLLLQVRDNGSGMDESTKSRVFEPFFTTKFTGRGLGLAAVLGIVRGHGGSIQVSSSPGNGTTFRVLFPAAAAPECAAAPENLPKQTEGAAVSGGAVLIIDDEPIVRKLARSALEPHGYSVLLAENGERGVDLFREHIELVRCIVLDLTMPVMGGEEALEQVKALRADVPVVLSSGYSEVEVIRRFEGKGLAGFIQKPYRTAALVEKVKEVVAFAKSTIRSRGEDLQDTESPRGREARLGGGA